MKIEARENSGFALEFSLIAKIDFFGNLLVSKTVSIRLKCCEKKKSKTRFSLISVILNIVSAQLV